MAENGVRRAAKKKVATLSRSPKRAVVKKSSSVLRKAAVTKKRFRASSGGYARVAVLDANDDNFGSALLNVFRENVAKARQENKRTFGSPDRVPEDI